MQTRRRTPTFFELMFFLLLLKAVILPADAAGNSTSEDDGSDCVIEDSPYAVAEVAATLFAALLAGAVGSLCFMLRGRVDKTIDEYREIGRRWALVNDLSPLHAKLVELLGLNDTYYSLEADSDGAALRDWCNRVAAELVRIQYHPVLLGEGEDQERMTVTHISQDTLVRCGVAEILSKAVRDRREPHLDQLDTIDINALNRNFSEYLKLVVAEQRSTMSPLVCRNVLNIFNKVARANSRAEFHRAFLSPHQVPYAQRYARPSLQLVEDEQVGRHVAVEELFSETRNRVLFIGEAGSGKSTFMRFLAHYFESEHAANRRPWGGAFDSVMPVTKQLFSKPEWVSRLAKGGKEVDKVIAECAVGELTPEAVEAAQNGGALIGWNRVLLVVDGLDQLNPKIDTLEGQALRKLKMWLKEKGKNVAYAVRANNDFQDERVNTKCTIRVRGVENINELVRAFGVGVGGDASELESDARAYFKKIRLNAPERSPGLCELHYQNFLNRRRNYAHAGDEGGESGQTIAASYEEAWQSFVGDWSGAHEEFAAQSQQFKNFLKEMAKKMHDESLDFISGSQMRTLWQASGLDGLDPNELLKGCPFLSCRDNSDNCWAVPWEFSHFSTQEYFVALAFVDEFVQGRLLFPLPDRVGLAETKRDLIWQFVVGLLKDNREHLQRFFDQFMDAKLLHPDDMVILFEATGLLHLPEEQSHWTFADDNPAWVKFKARVRYRSYRNASAEKCLAGDLLTALKTDSLQFARRVIAQARVQGVDVAAVIRQVGSENNSMDVVTFSHLSEGELSFELIDLLYSEAGLSFDDSFCLGDAPVYLVVRNPWGIDDFAQLIARGATIDSRILLHAIKSNSEEMLENVVNALREKGLDVGEEIYLEALERAVQHGYERSARWIKERLLPDYDLQQYFNEDGLSLLHVAVKNHSYCGANNEAVIHWLVRDCGFPINQPTNDGLDHFPVHVAAAVGDIKSLKILRELGADPNATNAAGETALFAICRRGFAGMWSTSHELEAATKNMLRYLLANGQSLDDQNTDRQLPEQLIEDRHETRKLRNVIAELRGCELPFPPTESEWDHAFSDFDGEGEGGDGEEMGRDIETGHGGVASGAAGGAAGGKEGADGGRRVSDAKAGASALGQFGGQGHRGVAAPLGNAPVLG